MGTTPLPAPPGHVARRRARHRTAGAASGASTSDDNPLLNPLPNPSQTLSQTLSRFPVSQTWSYPSRTLSQTVLQILSPSPSLAKKLSQLSSPSNHSSFLGGSQTQTFRLHLASPVLHFSPSSNARNHPGFPAAAATLSNPLSTKPLPRDFQNLFPTNMGCLSQQKASLHAPPHPEIYDDFASSRSSLTFLWRSTFTAEASQITDCKCTLACAT